MDILNARPFQIVVIGLFVFLAVVGLYMFATFNGFTGGKAPAGRVVIWGTVPNDGMEEAISALQAQDQRFSDVSYEEKSAQTFGAELSEAIASGEGPDMILISQEEILAQKNKIDIIPFSSISERTYQENFLPVTEVFLTSDGMYGVPVVVDPLVLYYNRQILANNGVVEAPRTWEAVQSLATRFTVRTVDGGIQRSLIGMGEYDNVSNARAILSLFLLQAGSNITERDTRGLRSSLTSAASGGNTTSAVNFYTQFADPTKTLYSWDRSMPDSRQAFLAGDVALYIGFASELPKLKAANPNLDFDMARIPQPGTVQNRVTYGLVYAFAIPKASANKSGAFAVAAAMALDGTAGDLARAVSMAPAQKSLLVADDTDKYGELFYPEALVTRTWLSPSPTETDAIFGTMIRNITTGRMDAQSALYTADQTLDEAL